MKPLSLTPNQAPPALAALRTAVASHAGRDWLALEASLCGYTGDLEALGPVDLAALAAALPDPTARAALVQRFVIVAMLADVSAESLVHLRRVARTLGAQVNTDLRYWDPWPHMEAPVAAVRARLAMG